MANEIDSNVIAITKKAIELVSTVTKYHLSTEKVAPAIDNTWSDEPLVMSGENKYLWVYYIYTYSDTSVVTSDPMLIGTTATSPLVCYVEPDSFILSSDEYGYVSDYKNNIQSVISLVQSEGGETKLLTLDKDLSENGTYKLSFIADGITFCELDGSLLKATDGTVMSADNATIQLTVDYLDFYGETGTIKRTISFVKTKQGQTGAYSVKQWCISESATTPGVSPVWLDEMPVLANSDKYVWYRSKDIPKGTDPDTVEWSSPELETTLRINMADSSLLIGQHEVALSGKRILLNGSVSADQLEAEMLIAQDLQITNGLDKDGNAIAGKIRSYGYEKGDVAKTDKTASGFYMDNDGNLEAINASFKNAQTYNLTMIGGEIQGENNPLNTLVSSSGEASFKNCSPDLTYVYGQDLYNLIASNCPQVDYVTQEMINAGGATLRLGNTTYPYVAKVNGTEATLSEGTLEAWATNTITNSSNHIAIECTYTFNFTASCPGVYSFEYIPPLVTVVSSGYVMAMNNVSYCADNGEWVSVRTSAGDVTSLSSSWILSCAFATSGSHTFTVKHVSSFYAFAQYLSDFCDGTTATKISFKQSAGVYAYLSANNSRWLAVVSFEEAYHDAYYSYGSVNSSSLTKYSKFTGIQKKANGGSSYSYYSVAGALSAKGLILNGVSKDEASIIYNLDSIYIYKNGVRIFSISPDDYFTYSNYPSFSFSALDYNKGVYVDDLYVKVDSSGNYKGSGDIGSGQRPFHYAYIDSLSGKTANLSNSLQAGSVQTDSLSVDSAKVDSLTVGSKGNVHIYEGSTYGAIDIYNNFATSQTIRWTIQAASGFLYINKDGVMKVHIGESGLYGAVAN